MMPIMLSINMPSSFKCHNIQHNSIRYNYTQNDNKNGTFRITVKDTECFYAGFLLSWVFKWNSLRWGSLKCHGLQHNSIRHNNTQYNIKNGSPSINGTRWWLSLFWVLLMLRATIKAIMLSVIMLLVMMLLVTAPKIFAVSFSVPSFENKINNYLSQITLIWNLCGNWWPVL